MFKEWFAQWSWDGLAFIYFGSLVYLGVMWAKGKMKGQVVIEWALTILGLAAILWLLGVRF